MHYHAEVYAKLSPYLSEAENGVAEAGDQSDLNQNEEQTGAGPLSGLWLLDHVVRRRHMWSLLLTVI